MPRSRCRYSSICLLLLVLVSSVLGAQQLPPGMKLAKIEVQGSSLFTPDEIGKMSGLRTGQDIDLAVLAKAAGTLAGWGYFAAVSFSYSYTGTNLTANFQIGDERKLLPALFDNFVSIRDEEIGEAIRQDYPSFAGKVPGAGTANEYIQGKVEKLLGQKGSPATVSFSEITGIGQIQMVFRQDKETPVCAVRVQGVSADAEPEILTAAAKLQKEPYSRQSINQFMNTTLIPAARKHGYWRLELQETTALQDASSCSSGATVLLRFNSGSVYSWGSAVWDGNQKQTTARLEELSGMRRGEIANIAKIESGLSGVASFYMTNGFLDFFMTPRPEQDDQRREVNYRIQLKEGEQYKMGEFACALPPGSGCDSIKSLWKIRGGEIMNGAYFDQFQAGPFAEWKKRGPQSGGTLSLAVQKNSATRVANVVVFAPVSR
jgi:outer membrane protein assembly factor BamA